MNSWKLLLLSYQDFPYSCLYHHQQVVRSVSLLHVLLNEIKVKWTWHLLDCIGCC